MEQKSLGKRINAARKERNITSEKLSELCNINATYLRQIESGKKTPSLPVFIAICQQLRVSPTYLLLDNFPGSDTTGIDGLLSLLQQATPSQLQLITAMLNSAVRSIAKMDE